MSRTLEARHLAHFDDGQIKYVFADRIRGAATENCAIQATVYSARMIKRVYKRVLWILFKALDPIYMKLEKSYYTRNSYFKYLPELQYRRGGTITLSEWGYTIGILQTLIHQNIPQKQATSILDVGCGCGRLAIACLPSMGKDDKYVGIEVMEGDYNFCKKNYTDDRLKFIFLNASNPSYSPIDIKSQPQWPVEDGAVDLVTSLSVWTHFSEDDATFYLKEVSRVLNGGGRAVISFFILDDASGEKTSGHSDYYPQPANKWVFDTPAYGSKNWLCPGWVKNPEDAIAIKEAAFARFVSKSGLKIKHIYKGYWRDKPGLFFQDIVVLEK